MVVMIGRPCAIGARLYCLSLRIGEVLFSFHRVGDPPEGVQRKFRLNAEAFLEIVAATNMKQRARKFYEYFRADRLNFAVGGTSNRLEYDQGFFVKNGDDAADVKPIAHLYKAQVYGLAKYLNIPEETRR